MANQGLEAARRTVLARTQLRIVFDIMHSQPDANGGNLFWACDTHGTGRISLSDVDKCLGALGKTLTPDTKRYLIDTFDPMGKGFVQYEEILCALHSPDPKHLALEATLRAAVDSVRRRSSIDARGGGGGAAGLPAPLAPSFLPQLPSPRGQQSQLSAAATVLASQYQHMFYDASHETVEAAGTEDDPALDLVVDTDDNLQYESQSGIVGSSANEAVQTALRFYRAAHETVRAPAPSACRLLPSREAASRLPYVVCVRGCTLAVGSAFGRNEARFLSTRSISSHCPIATTMCHFSHGSMCKVASRREHAAPASWPSSRGR